MNPKVSIIIPVYNVELYIEKCIESVINQTYANVEIILVDDGSKDKSLEMCYKYKSINNVKIYHKENGGLSDARNYGLTKATGEYVFFLDSDDYISYDAIEILVNSTVKFNSDITICNRYHYYDSGKMFIKFKTGYNEMKMESEKAIFLMNNFEYFDMSATCKLMKKDLFKSIKFPVGKISEDFFVMYKILDEAKKIVSIDKPLYYYYQREGSISKNPKLNKDFIEAAYQQCSYVEKKYPNLKECVRSACVSANMTSYNMVIASKGKVNKKDLKEIRTNVKKDIIYMKKNENISKIKKIQARLFIFSLPIYNVVFKIYKYLEKN